MTLLEWIHMSSLGSEMGRHAFRCAMYDGLHLSKRCRSLPQPPFPLDTVEFDLAAWDEAFTVWHELAHGIPPIPREPHQVH